MVTLHRLLIWHPELLGLESVVWFVRIDFITGPQMKMELEASSTGMLFPEASAPFTGLRIRSQTPRCEACM